ncbi:VOC family protein [Acetobacteraceae bacterium]|nr:VOC family protein [Candidatus Parcubacteria bacterium]
MLKTSTAFSSFSVSDLAGAKKFYSETLGLDVREIPEGLELHLANSTQIFIYPKQDHSPATFTVLNFIVDDIETEVDGLAQKSVVMEAYNIPPYIITDEKGIAGKSGDPRRMAWFKDPAGNILSLIQEK